MFDFTMTATCALPVKVVNMKSLLEYLIKFIMIWPISEGMDTSYH